MMKILKTAMAFALVFVLCFMAACGGDTPQEFKLSKAVLSLEVGASEQLTTEGGGDTTTWTTTKGEVATVSNGLVTAVSVGTAIVKATSDGREATCTVTVTAKPITLTLNKSATSIERGASEQLTPTVSPVGTTVTWETDNAAVATVSNGLVTAVDKGAAKITAKAGSVEAVCDVTVTDSRNLQLSTESVELGITDLTAEPVIEKQEVTAKIDGVAITDAVWEVADSAVATVSGGVITAVAEGETTVTATSQGLSKKITVKVFEYQVLDSTESFLAIGQPDAENKYPGMSGKYILDGDLEFDGIDYYSMGYVSGTIYEPFEGVLNGNGYALHNIVVKKKVGTGTALYNSGMFSKIGTKGVVKNLAISSIDLSVGTSCGVFGDTNLGTIENVYANVRFNSSEAAAPSINGGLVFRNSGTINNCLVTIEHNGGKSDIKGIAYYNDGTINNTFAVGRGVVEAVKTVGTMNNSGMKTSQEIITAATFATWSQDIWTVTEGELPYLGAGGQLDYNPNLEAAELSILASTEFPMGETTDILLGVAPVWKVGLITYESADETVATIDSGIVTAVSNGTTLVTATLGSGEGAIVKTCNVTIKYPTLALNTNYIRLGVSDIVTDSFLVVADIAGYDEGSALTFTSSKPEFVTVGTDGQLTAVAAGESLITVSGVKDGKTTVGECRVIVCNYIKLGTVKDFRQIGAPGTGDTYAGMTEDKMYLLTNNIDFYGVTDFYSMGVKNQTVRVPFEGVLNGNGYGLLNLSQKRDPRTTSTNPDSGQYEAGLFYTIGTKGIVKNISLVNTQIYANQNCGFIAGTNNGLIENVYASGSLQAVANNILTNSVIAGINNGTIRNVIANFALTGTAKGIELSIVSKNSGGTLENIYVSHSVADTITFNTVKTAENDATATNVAIKTIEELKAEALYESFDKTIWTVADGSLPYLKNSPNTNITVEALVMSKTATEIELGEGETLTVDGYTENIVWKSSDESVATVADGVITTVAAGEALITAEVDGKVGKCFVKVIDIAYTEIATAAQFYETFVDSTTHAPKAEAFADGMAYKLTANLDFTGMTFHALGVTGDMSKLAAGTLKGVSFGARLNGNGYALQNITLTPHPTAATSKFQGIFLGVTATGVIKNLGIVNMKMNGFDTSAVFGDAMQGRIENCFIDVDITLAAGGTRFAGIAMNPNLATSVIKDCFVQISTTSIAATVAIANDVKPVAKASGCRVKKVGGNLHGLVRAGGVTNCKYVATAAAGTDTLAETALATYSHFDTSIWTVAEGSLPYLKNMGGFPTRTQ